MRFVWLSAATVGATLAGGRSTGGEGALVGALTDGTFHVSARGHLGFTAVTAGFKIVDPPNARKRGVVAVVPLTPRRRMASTDLVLVAKGPAGATAWVGAAEPSTEC